MLRNEMSTEAYQMGNKLGCGCGSNHPKGYGDTPYSKQFNKHLIRFWAEVFLLAQDGAAATNPRSMSSKWQLVVPKLVPVNLARVQDSPAYISHATAYNTKVDKVMDVLIYHPGIDIFRGSDCFVYWTDPQKGLTWGLNFISSEDATSFVDFVCGRTKGVLCRRAISNAFLGPQKRNIPSKSAFSNPTTPEPSKNLSKKPSVKFADLPASRSADQSRQSTPTSSRQVEPPDTFQLILTGKRLSDWRTMLPSEERNQPDRLPSYDSATAVKTYGVYDNLKNVPETSLKTESAVGVWELQPDTVETDNPLQMSLDSAVLRKMLTPLHVEELTPVPEKTQFHTEVQFPINKPPRFPAPSHLDSSSSLSSLETTPEAVIKQDDRQIVIKGTPRTKRASLHLIAGENGSFRHMEQSPKVLADSGSSLSSSVDGNLPESVKTISVQKALGCKTRKAGFVLMKRWISTQNGTFTLVQNESWHQYWARLKGFNLHLYKVSPGNSEISYQSETSSSSNSPKDGVSTPGVSSKEPPVTLALFNALVQPIPEYPRRQNVFCISKGTGQAFLFQVTSESELDDWINNVHTAAAFEMARTTSRDVAIRTLKKELDKLEQKIETVSKMLRLAHLPSVSAVSTNQVSDWEREMEIVHVNQFTFRCYLSAVKTLELPSSTRVLSSACSQTKTYLSQLGIFTLSAMHSYVLWLAAQNDHNSTPTSSVVESPNKVSPLPAQSSPSSTPDQRPSPSSADSRRRSSLIHISLFTGQVTVVGVGHEDTVDTALTKACDKVGFVAKRHFLLLRKIGTPNECFVPHDQELLEPLLNIYEMELRERLVYHVHMRTDDCPEPLGLTVRTQRVGTELYAFVTAVEPGGPAHRKGLMAGDELLAVNLRSIRCLPSPVHVEQLLQRSHTLCLVLRTKRPSLPVWLEHLSLHSSRENLRLRCFKPFSDTEGPSTSGQVVQDESDANLEPWLSDSCGLLRHKVKYRYNNRASSMNRTKQRYSLPAPGCATPNTINGHDSASTHSSPLQFDKRYSMSNSAKRISNCEPGGMVENRNSLGVSEKLGPAERLEKIIFELVETEKAYVDYLDQFMRQYLEPLQKTSVLPQYETERLVSSTQAINRFQRGFLEELQEASGSDVQPKDVDTKKSAYATSGLLRNALLRVGGIFLNASNKFKVYSPFCATHFRIQKILRQEEKNEMVQQFLTSLNVQGQHASTFESFLIKPVQRVLRYPLFLQQMKTLTNQNTPENLLISEALTKMEKVAEYINEMQRVYEEYGATFSQIQKHHSTELLKRQISLELSDLLMFGEVDWLNSSEEIINKKKATSIECLCFVFKTLIMLLPQIEKPQKGRKKGANSDLPIHRLIPIKEAEVNGSDLGSTEGQYIWILIHMGASMSVEKVYHFANRRQEVKQQFLRAIRKAGFSKDSHTKTANGTATTMDDRASVSSPDSGLPGAASVQPNANEPGPNNGALAVNGDQPRPGSLYSSQSDGGYASNGELHRKE